MHANGSILSGRQQKKRKGDRAMPRNDEWSPQHGSGKDVLSAWVLAIIVLVLVFVANSV